MLQEKLINITSSDDFKEHTYIRKDDTNQFYRNELNNLSLILIHAPKTDFEVYIATTDEISLFFDYIHVDKNSLEFEKIEELKRNQYSIFVKGEASSMTLYYVSNQDDEEKST